ncbi:F-box protein AUF2 [Alnus glutinosa]|uniref:F-box protein AUF2 n=1 Tax=Alnus glutinosa TaxID=3517 RepID=UPI002D798622|nr:F-box protein AUF2 [Alnus glutinosa]
MDGFDPIPDSLVLLIFNFVSDVKTLIRCRAVSKRFNSLVSQAESLLLKVDCLISPESSDADSSPLTFLSSFLKNLLHSLVSPKPHPTRTHRSLQNSPAQILRGFQAIRDLEIELPSGNLKLEKNTAVKWRAEFGKNLRSCVIFGFRELRSSPPSQIPADFGEVGFAGGLKLRVVWTISALVEASSRHYLLREVVKEQTQLERLVLRDKDGEGTVVMDKDGLREFREDTAELQVSDDLSVVIGGEGGQGQGQGQGQGVWERKMGGRTTVPSVRLRMRHVLKLEVEGGGAWMSGATLVIVKPTSSSTSDDRGPQQQAMEADVEGDEEKDAELALEAFGGGVYGEAVRALVKTRGYLLEMNSF